MNAVQELIVSCRSTAGKNSRRSTRGGSTTAAFSDGASRSTLRESVVRSRASAGSGIQPLPGGGTCSSDSELREWRRQVEI